MTLAQIQHPLPLSDTSSCSALTASAQLAEQGGIEERGAIFTRREVVDFILDLVGYTPNRPLHKLRLLEPSFGGGDFLFPTIERLLAAWRKSGAKGNAHDVLCNAIRAVELHRETFRATREAVIETLRRSGIAPEPARALASHWLCLGDFLLLRMEGRFDYVVGNPPYVRQELIPSALLSEYRRRYQTMYGRADLYIPFIERSLALLEQGGSLGFICANRWMKNHYGGPLRELVDKHFHLKFYVDMTETPAFHSDVIAYPAITVICREPPGATQVALSPSIDRPTFSALAQAMLDSRGVGSVRTIPHLTRGSEPWLIESTDQMALLRKLEDRYPCLESAGCKVGIGVATGADKAFIGEYASLDVEPDRKLPLATTRDIVSGVVHWGGLGVINPFEDAGGLVDLGGYPRLKDYLEARREIIAKRYCARKTPANWFRTIDRITPTLARIPKLLIPDIKGEANVVYEQGNLYPHHNLYFITSSEWNLRALQSVLLSDVSRLFVAAYSTKMHGGFLRFQAQYIRRIRIPLWKTVPSQLKEELIEAAVRRDIQACNRAVFKLFELTADERAALGGKGD